ncbi:helix-turn-helix domain-containing protein [Agromyces subbeticus]|uniref:helix-turn-helix domain-containing protein n=1 Tax=Agromyces subbeticus TaxID=293890 RepID=UPI0003B78E1C|nr:XRE family transcriptional regulator [Agromyces subbeticus]
MSWNGDMLRMTRRASGMTQEDVIAALDGMITQAALSRYEASLRAPESDAIVDALARALGVTGRFLRAGERTFPMVSSTAHMRRQSTVSPPVWKDLEARLNLHRLHWSMLVDDIDITPQLQIPTFDDPSEIAPNAAAIFVREKWRMPLGPVEHLVGWLEAAGAIVIIEDYGTERVDGMSQWIGSWPVISLNERAPADRRRLTLAHELGHLVLHNQTPSVDAEDEANAFAAEFLMPTVEIRPLLKSGGFALGRLADLKQQWGVSMQALFERAYRLGLATAEDRKRFYQTLNARRWKKTEPGSELIPLETPRFQAHLVESLLERGLTRTDVAHMAGFADSEYASSILAEASPARRRLTIV